MRNLNLFFIAVAVTLFLYWLPLVSGTSKIGLDWDYFNALSWVSSNSLWSYETLPLYDPWVGGGLDILSNPQSRLMSPIFVLDLLFKAPTANLASLMLYSFFGFLGGVFLFQSMGATRFGALLGSFAFVGSNWFSLHFAEGHIPYGSMLLLPWIAWSLLNIYRIQAPLVLCALLSLMLLDGGIYTFVFSLLLILALLVTGQLDLLRLLRERLSQRAYRAVALLSAAGLGLLATAKLLPGIALHGSRTPSLETTELSLGQALYFWFNPQISPLMSESPLPYRFHEFGAYLGFVASLVVLWWALWERKKRSAAIRWFCVFALFIWMGTGWGSPVNPWTLVQQLPLINNAHVQSRVFVLALLAFSALVALAFSRVTKDGRVRALLVLAFVAEMSYAQIYPWASVISLKGYNTDRFDSFHHDTFEQTVRFGQKPGHYALGVGAKYTYEPAAPLTQVKAVNERGYRGEVYFVGDGSVAQTSGQVKIVDFQQDEMTVSYENKSLSGPEVIEVNLNAIAGWRVSEGEARILASESGLIRAEVPPGTGTFKIEYSPWYLNFVVLAFVLGVAALLAALILVRKERGGPGSNATENTDEGSAAGDADESRESDNTNLTPAKATVFDYSQIPQGHYDKVAYSGSSVRQLWHVLKFERVRACLPQNKGLSILDIGCFSGTFLGRLEEESFSRQVGVDILPEQVEYARVQYGAPFREFQAIGSISELGSLGEHFDCITAIELIEHLDHREIQNLLVSCHQLLTQQGHLVLTTPNYLSCWPLIELMINRFSDVSYEEQHLTKFTYFNFHRKLRQIHPELDSLFQIEAVYTSHFAAPFLAALSEGIARSSSRWVAPERWHFPFGNLLVIKLRRR